MVLWSLVVIGDLIVPMFPLRNDQSYKERLAEWLAKPTPEELKRHTLFKTGFSSKLLNTVLLIALFSMGCSLLGTLNAKSRSAFGFIEGAEENVIIRKYGDRYILAKYDWERQSFALQCRVVNVSDVRAPIVLRKLPTLTVTVDKISSSAPQRVPHK